MKQLFYLSSCIITLFQPAQCMLQKHSFGQKPAATSKAIYSAIQTKERNDSIAKYLCDSREDKLRQDCYKFAESKIAESKIERLVHAYLSPCRKKSLPKVQKSITKMRAQMESLLSSTEFAAACSRDQQSTLTWFLLPVDVLRNISEYICDYNTDLINRFDEEPVNTLYYYSLMQNKLKNDPKLARIYSTAQLCLVPTSAIITLFDLTKHFANKPTKQFLLDFQALGNLCKLDNKIFCDGYFKNKRVQTDTWKYFPGRRNVYSLEVFSNYLKNSLTEKPTNQARILSLLISSVNSAPDYSLDCDISLWNIEDKFKNIEDKPKNSEHNENSKNSKLLLGVGSIAYIIAASMFATYTVKNYCV